MIAAGRGRPRRPHSVIRSPSALPYLPSVVEAACGRLEGPHLNHRVPRQPAAFFARGYIHTTRDKEIPPALQQRFDERLGDGFRADVESGHLPMLETPSRLVTVIRDFLATV